MKNYPDCIGSSISLSVSFLIPCEQETSFYH